MKILHTADWHAGRSLHGVERTEEIREVLQEIAELAKTEAVDLILVAGDVYDSKNPSALAEEVVYEFFLEMGQASIPSVVIAGNHDSPSRLDAVKRLLKLSNVTVMGHPKVAGQGGVFDLPLKEGLARVAALPFVSERRIVKVAELLKADPGQWLEKYQQGMRGLVQNLTASFSSEVVNLLLMHTTMHGSTLSHSEYVFHCTETYALDASVLPENANYVALGHIHKAQGIQDFPEQAGRYSGSILQLDFGEQGDDKFVYIVEAFPAKPSKIKEVKLCGGKRLKRVSLDPESLDRKSFELAEFDGWLKLSLKLDKPRPGLKDRIKQNLKNVLAVDIILPELVPEEDEVVDLASMSLLEAYGQFYQERRSQPLPKDLHRAFADLLEEKSELEI